MKTSSTHRTPAFLITLDTEADDLWARTPDPTTNNAKFLPRFQALCQAFDFKPTYLVDFRMAGDPFFINFAKNVLGAQQGEIGMHLHAWDTPPHFALSDDDLRTHPYLFQYPTEIAIQKLRSVTDRLQNTFQIPVRSHRAGRWGLTASYASWLVDAGYTVDCSVTPGLSWGDNVGAFSVGGPDFRRFPSQPYWLSLQDLRVPGDSPLLEIPVTTAPRYPYDLENIPNRFLRRVAKKLLRPFSWLRPNGKNLEEMLTLLDANFARGASCVLFALHSSELMPGGSPTFRSAHSIEVLYAHLEQLFESARTRFRGLTLSEFRSEFEFACPGSTS